MRSFDIALFPPEKKNVDLCAEMLLKVIKHVLQRPGYQRGSSQKDPSSHWGIWWTPDYGQEKETKVIWPRHYVFWFHKNNSKGQWK